MQINASQLMTAYEAVRALLKNNPLAAEQFHQTEIIFEDKKKKSDASIMVYGVYNAGKSTLINVLLGKEEALVDDIPTTDRITTYRWGTYSILDTPGVDAPIEHEHVTKAQMLKADAVIFVVDPVGTAEEAKTLAVLMDLVRERKQIFLVFNEKKPITEEDFIKLKDQTRQILQEMAAERGLGEVLKDIPIVKINAKRALQGLLKQQPKLVELSGYAAFEKQLSHFLQSISPNDIYGRLKKNLTTFLENYASILERCSTSEAVKNYEKLLREISLEKTHLCQSLESELSFCKNHLYDKSRFFVLTEPNVCQAKIEKLSQELGQLLSNKLQAELGVFIKNIQNEIEALQASMPALVMAEIPPINLPIFEKTPQPIVEENIDAQHSSTINPALLKAAAEQITARARPEHIVDSLKLVKNTLPSLMKGIGQKTMEKWAGVAVAKWIPYIGVVVSIAGVLSSIISGDAEEKQLRQQAEEQIRAKERALQQIEDFACEISNRFESAMHNIIQNELDTFFAAVVHQVDALREGFNQRDRANSQQLEKLLEIQQIALGA